MTGPAVGVGARYRCTRSGGVYLVQRLEREPSERGGRRRVVLTPVAVGAPVTLPESFLLAGEGFEPLPDA